MTEGDASRASRPWQVQMLDTLRQVLPGAALEPYGSVLAPTTLDGWSDLDCSVTWDVPIDVEATLGPLWTWQEARAGGRTVLRTVLADGRRADLSITGASVLLPTPPADLDVRFDAALAATRLGRGSALVGLHLVLGVVREGLVQSMLAADAAAGTAHHRRATAEDEHAEEAAHLLAGNLRPELALEAYRFYARGRASHEHAFVADPSGLEAVLERGMTAGCAAHP